MIIYLFISIIIKITYKKDREWKSVQVVAEQENANGVKAVEKIAVGRIVKNAMVPENAVIKHHQDTDVMVQVKLQRYRSTISMI